MGIRGARPAVLLALVAVIAALVLPAAASPARSTTHVTLTSLEAGVLTQLNDIRAEHSLVPLRLSAPLTDAATQHSREMGADGYFAHNSRDGAPFSQRVAHWYGASGYRMWSVGENLLWSSPGIGPVSALKLWMNSPPHRANILDPNWREIGVSAVHVQGAPGVYRGLPVTIITTDFGVRR